MADRLGWNAFRSRMAGQGCSQKRFSVLYQEYKKGSSIDNLRCVPSGPFTYRRKGKRPSLEQKSPEDTKRESIPFEEIKRRVDRSRDFEFRIREWTLLSDSAIIFYRYGNKYSVQMTAEEAGSYDPRIVYSSIIPLVIKDFPKGKRSITVTRKKWDSILKKALKAKSTDSTFVTMEILREE